MLAFFARHGRWVLFASLSIGLISNTATGLVRPFLAVLIALLLFVACLRVGPQAFMRSLAAMRQDLSAIVILQLVLPLLAGLLCRWLNAPASITLVAVLLTAAPGLSGSPHLVTLLGYEPSNALRMMVLSTTVLPVTVLPVFLVVPQIGGLVDVVLAAVRLAAIIFVAAAAAFFIRKRFLPTLRASDYLRIDGIATILLAVTVVGLMSAVQPLLLADPQRLLGLFAAATVVNFGLQAMASAVAKQFFPKRPAVHLGVIAGNRNIALFLTALPAATTDPLLAFIGCYQVPMYLTPLVMRSYYHFLGPVDVAIKK